jgi:antitoxin (DNA-binding transcriptional repressor) of toxin-antitoxin stability system
MRRVRDGETFEVTHDGKPIALLLPLPAGRIERLIAGGDVSEARPLAQPIRRFPATGPMAASAALEEERAER